jgi:hypothetical protein
MRLDIFSGVIVVARSEQGTSQVATGKDKCSSFAYKKCW